MYRKTGCDISVFCAGLVCNEICYIIASSTQEHKLMNTIYLRKYWPMNMEGNNVHMGIFYARCAFVSVLLCLESTFSRVAYKVWLINGKIIDLSDNTL